MIRIFNTLSGKKEPLPSKRPLRLFVCGPTVYDYSHLGHARTYINFDIVARYLKSASVPLFYLQNITDIDDKIIERARQLGLTSQKLAKKFEKAYYEDMKKLGVTSVTKYAPAGQFIKEIQKQISSLIKKGYAYKTGSGVWFEVKKFKNYGELSRQNPEALKSGYRIEPDHSKKDVLDFSLWKNKKTSQEPSWPSPWGEGRPGWHIEDTAISEKYFGPQYDVHGGGVDLKFPHHEAEIAQAEAISEKKPYVKIWLHTGFLLAAGEKMSKSLGNFVTIKNFLKNYDQNVLRLLVFSSHYRSPVNYDNSLAASAEKSLLGIDDFLGKLRLIRKPGREVPTAKGRPKIREKMEKCEKLFTAALENDFNTPKALAAIFGFIASLQKELWRLDPREAKIAAALAKEKLEILGIRPKLPEIPGPIKTLARRREKLRGDKQFIKADALRRKMESLGYMAEDTPLGPYLKKTGRPPK